MSQTADFLIVNALQANFVLSGEKARPSGKGGDGLKWMFIVNTLAVDLLPAFTGDGRLVVRHHGETVLDLDGRFLHDGCPRRHLPAVRASTVRVGRPPAPGSGRASRPGGGHQGGALRSPAPGGLGLPLEWWRPTHPAGRRGSGVVSIESDGDEPGSAAAISG